MPYWIGNALPIINANTIDKVASQQIKTIILQLNEIQARLLSMKI